MGFLFRIFMFDLKIGLVEGIVKLVFRKEVDVFY